MESVQAFSRQSRDYEIVNNILSPRLIASKGSSIAQLFAPGEQKVQQLVANAIQRCNNCSTLPANLTCNSFEIFEKMEIQGWGCQNVKTIPSTKYDLGPLLPASCSDGKCDNKPKLIGS